MYNILLLDTEQTYGDIGYVVVSNGQVVCERQIVIKEVIAGANHNDGFKRKMSAYSKLPKEIYTETNFSNAFEVLKADIQRHNVNMLVTHNLAADRKVLNSWCSIGGISHLNPFTLIKNEFDSQNLVKVLTADPKTYSIEDFVRELTGDKFIQEHTGLADARLLAKIFCAVSEKDLELLLNNTMFQLYCENEKGGLDTLKEGKQSSGKTAQLLKSLDYANEVFNTKGERYKTPKYELNSRSRVLFEAFDSFNRNKYAIRQKITNSLNHATLVKIAETNGHPQQQQATVMLEKYNETLNKMIREHNFKLQQDESKHKAKLDQVAKEYAVRNEIAVNQARKDARNIIDAAETDAHIIKEEAKEKLDQAKQELLKAKAIHWGSWADRIFWPLLGLGLGVASFFLMNIYFLN